MKDPTSFLHLSFQFLDPKNIRDKNRKRPDEEGYDPTTLYVPESFLKDQTVGFFMNTLEQLTLSFYDIVETVPFNTVMSKTALCRLHSEA